MTAIVYAKRAMLKALRKCGIATVSIAYDGEGDSGQIRDIFAFDTEKRDVRTNDPVRLALYAGKAAADYASLYEALDDFAWLLLAHFHAGFEIDDGGYGTITIDVTGRGVTLSHNDRVIEAVNTYTEA